MYRVLDTYLVAHTYHDNIASQTQDGATTEKDSPEPSGEEMLPQKAEQPQVSTNTGVISAVADNLPSSESADIDPGGQPYPGTWRYLLLCTCPLKLIVWLS